MKKTALATMLSAAVICAGMSASAFAQDANAQAESTTEQSTQVVDTHMQAAIDVVEQTGTIPPFEGTLKQIVLNSKRWLIAKIRLLKKISLQLLMKFPKNMKIKGPSWFAPSPWLGRAI